VLSILLLLPFASPESRLFIQPPLHLYSLSAWLKGGSARIVSGDSGTVPDTGRFLKVLRSRKDSVHGLPRVEVSRWEHPMKPTLRLEIRPDGRVRKAAVTCSECAPPVKDWLVGQARRLRFPASEGALQIVWRPEVRQGLRRPHPKLRTVSLAGAERKLLDSLKPELEYLAPRLGHRIEELQGEMQDVGDTLTVEFSIRPDGGVMQAARVPATDRIHDSIFLVPLLRMRFKPVPSEVRVRWRLRIALDWRR